MRTVTIRDLRQRWPEVEAALQAEDEILITRDSRPVAKLVRVAERVPKQKRWSVEEHKKWIRKVYGIKIFPGSDAELARARADRWEKELG